MKITTDIIGVAGTRTFTSNIDYNLYSFLKKMGTVTLDVNGTAVVSDTFVKSNSVILLTPQPGPVQTGFWQFTVTPNVGFTITSNTLSTNAGVIVGYLINNSIQ